MRAIMTLLLAVPTAAAGAGCALDPTLPQSLTAHAATQPLCAGFLNASAPPYSAAGDGVTDDSSALQAALDDAYANRMAVLLPAGRTFLLARQLRAGQRTGLPPDRQRGYQLFGNGALGEKLLDAIVHLLNGRSLSALGRLCGCLPPPPSEAPPQDPWSFAE